MGTLAVSRALGDPEFKGFYRGQPSGGLKVVTPEPDIKETSLIVDDQFIGIKMTIDHIEILWG